MTQNEFTLEYTLRQGNPPTIDVMRTLIASECFDDQFCESTVWDDPINWKKIDDMHRYMHPTSLKSYCVRNNIITNADAKQFIANMKCKPSGVSEAWLLRLCSYLAQLEF